jgi:hypothetical protein
MRVSFDSNAWEKIFSPADCKCAPVRAALKARRLDGFICEAAFRIEAIRKRDRADYFKQPHGDLQFDRIVTQNGRSHLEMSFGPLDDHHLGLHGAPASKLQSALAAGIRLMRGSNWMGLPSPQEIRDPTIFVPETPEATHEREQRQLDVSTLIDARGVGKAKFDAADGWSDRITDTNRFREACAEWADGELVAAHIAYQNDILCTNDCARTAGKSVFDVTNREWLTINYGVVFKTIDELLAEIAKSSQCPDS